MPIDSSWRDSGTLEFGVTGDTAISRISAGVLAIGNGVAGDSSGTILAAGHKTPLAKLSGSTDAVPPHTPASYVITTAGVDAMTLAAPTAGTDDGLMISISSSTANAHTLTATGLLQTGSASVNVATFASSAGAGLTLQAYNAKWIVKYQIGITFS